jgi:hypothetical protein
MVMKMPVGGIKKYDWKLLKSALFEFADFLSVGDIVTNDCIVNYLSSINGNKIKKMNRSYRFRKDSLQNSSSLFSEILARHPHILRGVIGQLFSDDTRKMTIFLKTDDDMSFVCIDCGSDTTIPRPREFFDTKKTKRRSMKRHVRCKTCYENEINRVANMRNKKYKTLDWGKDLDRITEEDYDE